MADTPSDSPPSAQETRQAILHSHRELGKLLGELEGAVDDHGVRLKLERLRPVLSRHFAHEEAPFGLYGILRSKAPWLEREIGRMLAEHAAILEEVSALIQREHGLRKAIRNVVQTLQLHERRENDLLLRVLNTDPD